ncbi:hypothetical protein [Nocardia sp. CA-119907]|uniref:hypothetical protein n=1 Tax=Nocardia sp. CA-119907 TaxID=3239973 RepID=UPI003D9648D0
MITFEVTLTDLICDFANGGDAEISGTLFAKAFKRDRGLVDAKTLFNSPTPVRLTAGQTQPVGKTVRLVLARDSSELSVVGEILGLGGNLGICGDRYVMMLSFNADGNTDVRFVSDDSNVIVRARYKAEVVGGPVV